MNADRQARDIARAAQKRYATTTWHGRIAYYVGLVGFRVVLIALAVAVVGGVVLGVIALLRWLWGAAFGG